MYSKRNVYRTNLLSFGLNCKLVIVSVDLFNTLQQHIKLSAQHGM